MYVEQLNTTKEKELYVEAPEKLYLEAPEELYLEDLKVKAAKKAMKAVEQELNLEGKKLNLMEDLTVPSCRRVVGETVTFSYLTFSYFNDNQQVSLCLP